MGSSCGQTFAFCLRLWLVIKPFVMFFNARKCGAVKEGATKHCSWDTYKSESRFKQKPPEGTGFVQCVKPGKLKDGLNEWEKKSRAGENREGKMLVPRLRTKRFL